MKMAIEILLLQRISPLKFGINKNGEERFSPPIARSVQIFQ